jgi:hypothetical protein
MVENGLNGLLSNSISQYVLVSATPLYDTLCGKTAVTLPINVVSLVCTPVVVDSITAISAIGRVKTSRPSDTLQASGVTIPLDYIPSAAGVDTIQLKVWYHGTEYNVGESSTITTIATSTTYPAMLSITDSLDFGTVRVDSTRLLSIEIWNTGCAELRVDSIVSSNDGLFIVNAPGLPWHIISDSFVTVGVRYSPTTKGRSIESLEIGTNAGHTFVRLTGNAVVGAVESVERESAQTISIYPNPAANYLNVSGSVAGAIDIYDILGRRVRTYDNAVAPTALSLDGLPDGSYTIVIGGSPRRFVIHR